MAALKAALPPQPPYYRASALDDTTDGVTSNPTKLTMAQLRKACDQLGVSKTGAWPACM